MGNWRPATVVALGCLVIAAIIGTAFAAEDAENETFGDLEKFASNEEIEAFLKEHARGGWNSNGYSRTTGGVVPEGDYAPAPMATSAPTSSAGDYSTTNVQVEGVDEADFLKNDGKYIYVISGERLVIIEAFPPEDAKIISDTRIDGSPKALFLAGDRLVVFATTTEEEMTAVEGSVTSVPVWRTVTHAYVYDISDQKDPEQVRDVTFTGNYYDARMVGDYVYTITQESPGWVRDRIALPEVRSGSGEWVQPDVYRPGSPLQNYVFYTAGGFSVRDDTGAPDAETFLLGYDTTLFASQENLYIGYRNMGPVSSDVAVEVPPDGSGTREETIIHRFAIDDGRIDYKAMGEVPGHLLN
ncbi:MAG: hypothetical protein GX837_00980, partial [Methanomicrobiales archaeon]|nr:hypothetical protein [Methanomicrobiales archaeon]